MVVRQQAETATVASNVYINSHLEQGQLRFVPSAASAERRFRVQYTCRGDRHVRT